jgi:excisionase family DNA binding protein
MMGTNTNVDAVGKYGEDAVPQGMFPDTYRLYKLDVARLLRQLHPSENRKRNCAGRKRPSTNEQRVLKTQAAADYLGISPWKLRNLVQAGEIPCIFGDGTTPWLFDKRDLDSWIDRRKQTL